MIDIPAGDKVPRKEGAGITETCDLRVINKIDLTPLVGANLDMMQRDAAMMRGERPFLFSNLKSGQGLDEIIQFIETEGLLRAPAAA